MNFSIMASLAVMAVVVSGASVGSEDYSSEAYIKNYIDENQSELYETILMNFIGEHRRQLSRKQLEQALNKIDQLEPYYITLRIYRSLCSIYKQGESITHLSDEEFQLILDEARDFPQILDDLEQNWDQHASIAEEYCVANGAVRHEDKHEVVVVDDTVDDIFGTNDPVTEDPTDYDDTTDYEAGTDAPGTVFVTDDGSSTFTSETATDEPAVSVGGVDVDDSGVDSGINGGIDSGIDSGVDTIETHIDNIGDKIDETEVDIDDFITVETSGSGSGGSGSGSGSGSGASGSGDDLPITDSASMIGFTVFAVVLSLVI